MENDSSYQLLPGVFQSYRWDYASHKWGFIKDSISQQSYFFHHSCLEIELDSHNRNEYYVYWLGISPKTNKVCCSRITCFNDEVVKEFITHYEEYSDEYKKFIDNNLRCYIDYITEFPIDSIPNKVKQRTSNLIEHLKRISSGILYSCFEVAFSQGTVYRRDPDDRWFSQRFWGTIADDSYYKGWADSYVNRLISSKCIDEFGNVLQEDIYNTQREYYNKWRQEIINEYDITKHVDSLIEDTIDFEKSRHSSHLSRCGFHCCSKLANEYFTRYIQEYMDEILKQKDELELAAHLSSNSIEYNGFVYCVNSEKNTVTLQTTAGAFGNCTNYLKPESDDTSVLFRIPESIIAHGIQYPVTGIARGVFDSMKQLRTIFIPRYVESIKWSFWECDQLESIIVDPDNTHFCDIDGVLFSFDKQTLIAFPQNKSIEYTIPEGVKRIENLAFKNNKKIQRVFIPDTLSSIGFNAFYRCEHLEEIHGGINHKITVEGLYGEYGKVNPRVVFDKEDNNVRRSLRSMIGYPHDDNGFEVYP